MPHSTPFCKRQRSYPLKIYDSFSIINILLITSTLHMWKHCLNCHNSAYNTTYSEKMYKFCVLYNKFKWLFLTYWHRLFICNVSRGQTFLGVCVCMCVFRVNWHISYWALSMGQGFFHALWKCEIISTSKVSLDACFVHHILQIELGFKLVKQLQATKCGVRLHEWSSKIVKIIINQYPKKLPSQLPCLDKIALKT